MIIMERLASRRSDTLSTLKRSAVAVATLATVTISACNSQSPTIQTFPRQIEDARKAVSAKCMPLDGDVVAMYLRNLSFSGQDKLAIDMAMATRMIADTLPPFRISGCPATNVVRAVAAEYPLFSSKRGLGTNAHTVKGILPSLVRINRALIGTLNHNFPEYVRIESRRASTELFRYALVDSKAAMRRAQKYTRDTKNGTMEVNQMLRRRNCL